MDGNEREPDTQPVAAMAETRATMKPIDADTPHVDQDSQDALGRLADDSNQLAAITGISYAPVVNPSLGEVLAILDPSLGEGMQVPLVIGTCSRPQAHGVLVQYLRDVGSGLEYNVFDPASGRSAWLTTSDIVRGAFPGGNDRVGTIHVPTALAVVNANASVGAKIVGPA